MTGSPSLDCSNPISPSELREFESVADSIVADIISARAAFLDRQAKTSYSEIGMIAEYVERRQLWKHVINPAFKRPCQSQNEWLMFVAPFGRSTWFGAKKTWKDLADIPAEEKVLIPRSNLVVMQKLSTAVRKDPEIIKAAQNLSENEFKQKLETEHPEQHLSADDPMEQAIRMAMVLEEDCGGRRAAMAAIADYYIAEHAAEFEETKSA